MRVLHCIWRMSVGGAERQLIQLTAGLIGKGVDVHVVTVYPGSCDEQLAATGATMHRLRPLGRYDVTLIPRVMGLIRSLKPHVVATWLMQMDIVGGMAAKLSRVPWIICERSVAGSYPPGLIHDLRART